MSESVLRPNHPRVQRQAGGWRGDGCVEAIPSMIVTDTVNASYSGVYAPTTMTCYNSVLCCSLTLVYPKGGPGGLLLWSADGRENRWVVSGSLVRTGEWAGHPDWFVCRAASESDYHLKLTRNGATPAASSSYGACPSSNAPCAENNVTGCAHPQRGGCDEHDRFSSCNWCEEPSISVVASDNL